MKRSKGVYAYLEKQGVLQTGDDKLIKEAKKTYWRKYKKDWNRKNLSLKKSFSVSFTKKELSSIKEASSKHNTSRTSFIKQSALSFASNKPLIDRVALGEVRELLHSHYTTFLALIEEDRLPFQLEDLILEKFSTLETQVLGLLRKESSNIEIEGRF